MGTVSGDAPAATIAAKPPQTKPSKTQR